MNVCIDRSPFAVRAFQVLLVSSGITNATTNFFWSPIITKSLLESDGAVVKMFRPGDKDPWFDFYQCPITPTAFSFRTPRPASYVLIASLCMQQMFNKRADSAVARDKMS